jgi:hypothetical protein
VDILNWSLKRNYRKFTSLNIQQLDICTTNINSRSWTVLIWPIQMKNWTVSSKQEPIYSLQWTITLISVKDVDWD